LIYTPKFQILYIGTVQFFELRFPSIVTTNFNTYDIDTTGKPYSKSISGNTIKYHVKIHTLEETEITLDAMLDTGISFNYKSRDNNDVSHVEKKYLGSF
jgi:hypothetical protein